MVSTDVAAATVERVDEASGAWWPEHRSRYHFAAPHVAGRTVLDIACGTGYGGRILAEAGAGRVVSVDLSRDGLRAALAAKAPSQVFCLADGTALPFPDACMDVVTSFETIEHLRDMEEFVCELRRTLASDGTLFLSTPNAWFTKPVDGTPKNPYHVRELTPPELTELLEGSFKHVELRGQRTSAGYGVCPYWELPEHLPRTVRGRAGVLTWKALARVPPPWRDTLSQRLHGRTFYPGEHDFEFTAENVRTGHVLLAVCRP